MDGSMLAMAVDQEARLLRPTTRPIPTPGRGQVLLRVRACGVCRTDLHILDGELPPHREAVVPGHEIVGEVVERGPDAARLALGTRVGVSWLGQVCGTCDYCRAGQENLCDHATFTGYDRDGGYAQFAVADEPFCFALPDAYDDAHAAPLLCAGLIGYRTWRLAGGTRPRRIGIWGFGAAAHMVCQVAVAHGQSIYAFTRPGDTCSQAFAREMGAAWAGGSEEAPSAMLDAALIFAPAGELVPEALSAVRKGGVVVCGGIHMSDIPAFPYALLWGERVLRSVANVTRQDAADFLALLDRTPVRTQVQGYPLADANRALDDLRHGRLQGAAVLLP